jgi:hypothetical protein
MACYGSAGMELQEKLDGASMGRDGAWLGAGGAVRGTRRKFCEAFPGWRVPFQNREHYGIVKVTRF